MFEVTAVVVSVIVVSAIVVSAIVVTSIALIATTVTVIAFTAVVNTAAPVLAVVVTAVATAVILPSHSYFQSRGLHLSGYGHSGHSHSSRMYTGYSLSHSSHSGLHAAVVGRVAKVAVVFCHCNSDLSQFTHSEYNLGCRIKDHGHSRVCMQSQQL